MKGSLRDEKQYKKKPQALSDLLHKIILENKKTTATTLGLV